MARCPVDCPCLCHDTGGGVHDHPGGPCPGKGDLERILDAWTVEGHNPAYHGRLVATVRHKWPVLATALDGAARERGRRG